MLILEDNTTASIEHVGGKGKGLLELKALKRRLESDENPNFFKTCEEYKVEIPDFFIIPPELDLNSATAKILEQAEKIGSLYAVRSSSPLEDVGEHSFDGIFDSFLEVQQADLIATIQKVRQSATAERAQQYSREHELSLDERMAVIVQKMAGSARSNNYTYSTGVMYTKFPCRYDVTKIVIDSEGRRLYAVFDRQKTKNEIIYPDIIQPRLINEFIQYIAEELAELGCRIEQELGNPRIIEFALKQPTYFPSQTTIALLQARRLTRTFEGESPELQQEGYIGSSYDCNSVGIYTGTAFVLNDIYNLEELTDFDKQHQEGYVLITPCLEFNQWNILAACPHKRAVVCYENISSHHDMELARKNNILLISCKSIGNILTDPSIIIKTGDTITVASDGIIAHVYKN